MSLDKYSVLAVGVAVPIGGALARVIRLVHALAAGDEQAGTLRVCRQIQRDRDGKRWVSITPKRNSMRTLTLGPKITTALCQYRWQCAARREAMG